MSILFAPFRAIENYFFPQAPKDRIDQIWDAITGYAPIVKEYQNTALVAVGTPLALLVSYKLMTRNGGQIIDAVDNVLDGFVDVLSQAIIERILAITFDKLIGFKPAEKAARMLELDNPENMLRIKEEFADYLVRNKDSESINPLRDIRASESQLDIKFAGFVNSQAKHLVEDKKVDSKLTV